MADIASFSSAENPTQNFNNALFNLEQEIRFHKKRDDSRSYLTRGIDAVAGIFWHSDSDSLQELERLDKDAKAAAASGDTQKMSQLTAEIQKDIKKDQDALGTKDSIGHYGGELFKIGSLFYGGAPGWIGSGLFYAADQANPNDGIGTQMLDASLGGLKGVALKGAITSIGGQDWNFAMKGATMGVANRLIDEGLTRQTYLDSNGDFSFGTGLSKVATDTFNGKALLTDAVVFGAGFGLGKAVQFLAPAVEASPFMSTVAFGGSFGFASGTLGEASREIANHEPLSLKKILANGAIEGAVFSVASVPGALQAQAQYESIRRDMQEKAAAQTQGSALDTPTIQYKKVGTVQAEQLTQDTTWTANGAPMEGKAGDWKVTGSDGSVWTVKPDIFAKTYGEVSPGVYAKTATTNAQLITRDMTVHTLEGDVPAKAGDYLVTGPNGEQYPVTAAKFKSMYLQLDGSAPPVLPPTNIAVDTPRIQYKKSGTVQAERLTADMEWTTNGAKMEGKAGDWKVTGPDGGIWTIKPDIFAKTYTEVSPGVYAKSALATAQLIPHDMIVHTLEGDVPASAGDFLVTGPAGEQYPVPAAKFRGMYKQVDGSAPPALK